MTTAQNIAAELGRDWIDCGAYERMSFEDEARRRNALESPTSAIRDFLAAVDRGYLGQMPAGFNDSAFVKALRAQVKQCA